MQGLHHMHVRKRASKKTTSPYPHPTPWKRKFDYVMYCVAFLSPATFIPQVALIYSTQDASGLSFISWALANGTNLLWLSYGYIHRDIALIGNGIVAAGLNGLMIYGIYLYG